MSIIDRDLTTIAFCWRLERRDGVTLGFTTHDRDLMVDGLRYRAAPGMLPSAITQSDGFDADTLEVTGALTSDAITARDLAAGRWDGAAVRVFMIDWTDPEGENVAVARGTLGDVSVTGEGFSASLSGPAAMLDAPVVELTSPECRAILGDKRCRIDMAARTRITEIVAIVAEDVIDVASAAPGNAYAYGRLRWLTGPNSGLENPILASAGTRLTLRDTPAFASAVGDRVEIMEGCDKQFSTCVQRFANAVNFRGEPHLPGVDLLTRYPGA
ncbi:DUF2163 domain-containing protein [Allosphingosinicella humi]